MRIFLTVVGIVLLYLVLSVITIIVAMYTDRIAGESPGRVYENFYVYVCIGFFWPVSFPIILGILIFEKIKRFVIATTETMVARKEIKNDFSDKMGSDTGADEKGREKWKE